MSYLDVASNTVVAELPGEQKAGFIRRTYGHLALAIAAFALVEAQLLKLGLGEQMMALLGSFQYSWLVLLGAYILVSKVADNWARSGTSRETQYFGLALYIAALSIIFLPLMYIASSYAPKVISHAGLITAALVGGLTLVVFTTRKDFSFFGPALSIGGVIALGIIIASVLFGMTLGMYFAAAMVVFTAISVLYTTSNILHVYREEQHVAASLALFASVAMMFYYLVYFFLSFGDE